MWTFGEGNTLLGYLLCGAWKQLACVASKQHACSTVFFGQAVVGFMWDLDCEVSLTVEGEICKYNIFICKVK